MLWRSDTGTGILTCCPSTTLFSLALGPTNPTPINVAWETLGFRCRSFSLRFKLLMPTFSLPDAPPNLTVRLQCRQERSSTTYTIKYKSVASVIDLAPLDFRRKIASNDCGPVSCYALFKGIAASKPTSWLSKQSHILYHLIYIRDLSRRSGLFPF